MPEPIPALRPVTLSRSKPPNYLLYAVTDGIHTLLWLPVQHVPLTIAGHQADDTAVAHGSESATYLLPVTTVAAINFWAERGYGDYAAYTGVGLPIQTDDIARVYHVAHHGNKIEEALAERLFRVWIDRRFGKGIIKYRS